MNRIEAIARVCNEANRAWCEANGDHSQRDWQSAEPWQRESAIKGVEFALANPNAPESAQHDAWMADDQGWMGLRSNERYSRQDASFDRSVRRIAA